MSALTAARPRLRFATRIVVRQYCRVPTSMVVLPAAASTVGTCGQRIVYKATPP
ncbi:hypothetical protein AB0903_19760 [Streptomyces sp. NPDC048389]|uniref:hypothetical protein n=1 Tax=Streptomyces sp. NPDC048389 TaxID=3154622 RepID=UPI003451A18E